jgi:WD40 repeat protein
MIKYFTPHLTNVHGFQGHREACHAVGWSPNDERFVTGGDDGLVKIWNYREAKEERALTGELRFSWLSTPGEGGRESSESALSIAGLY